jgi:hypothetical protein
LLITGCDLLWYYRQEKFATGDSFFSFNCALGRAIEMRQWEPYCASAHRSAVYPHRHHLSAKVRTFIDLLAQHSAQQQKLINPYS